jgi:hypothetical protein
MLISIFWQKGFYLLWMLMPLHIHWFNSGSHSHAHCQKPILARKLPKVLLKLSIHIVSTSYGGLKSHLGDFWSLGLPLMVLQIQQETP